MSIFVGTDGFERFQLGWADDSEARIYARLGRADVRALRRQIARVLDEQYVEDDLRAVRAERDALLRSNAALRGALKKAKKGRRK